MILSTFFLKFMTIRWGGQTIFFVSSNIYWLLGLVLGLGLASLYNCISWRMFMKRNIDCIIQNILYAFFMLGLVLGLGLPYYNNNLVLVILIFITIWCGSHTVFLVSSNIMNVLLSQGEY